VRGRGTVKCGKEKNRGKVRTPEGDGEVVGKKSTLLKSTTNDLTTGEKGESRTQIG